MAHFNHFNHILVLNCLFLCPSWFTFCLILWRLLERKCFSLGPWWPVHKWMPLVSALFLDSNCTKYRKNREICPSQVSQLKMELFFLALPFLTYGAPWLARPLGVSPPLAGRSWSRSLVWSHNVQNQRRWLDILSHLCWNQALYTLNPVTELSPRANSYCF